MDPPTDEDPKRNSKQHGGHGHHKLAKLPKSTSLSPKPEFVLYVANQTPDAHISKRPLLRPPIPSKNASKSHQKVIYISHRTPFISAVKRVRKLLALADRRAVQSRTEHLSQNDPRRVEKMAAVVVRPGDEEAEEVWVKGAGRSVQKALQIAVFLQGKGDLRVRLRTGSVWAVDDVVLDEEGDGDGEEVPETRKRRISVLEVGVSLK